MNNIDKRASPLLRLTALATLAVAGLAGCAVPYPVYESQSPEPVYQYPGQYPQAQQQPDRRDYRRRDQERLYEAEVTSVRAVVGPGAQRCWMEREEVVQQPQRNVPGAIVGAVIGGILGHQIGNGTGRDIATVGGAVAGAAVGSNVGRGGFGNQPQTQEVQRCTSASGRPNGQPDYWDVTYTFRGMGHRAQMTSPPGRTILVNGNGEPRI